MKRTLAFTSLALVTLAACTSDTTTSPSTAASKLTPRYGTKPSPAPPPANPLVCPTGAPCQKFDGSPSAADGDVGIASSSFPTTTAPADSVTFAGRFANYIMAFTPGLTGNITLTLNLYTIGTWSGDAKKGPSQQWQLGYMCNGGNPTLIVNATFSNRLGNAQSYPYNVESTKHGGGMNGATGLDILNYKSRPDLQDTFHQYSTDVGDARYAIQRTIPACPAGQTRVVFFKGLNLANIFNASWGVDNISVQ